MSHQDRLGNNGPEATGLTKPDDDDDRVQNKRENVAHAQDGIKLKKVKNYERLRNSPTTSRLCGTMCSARRYRQNSKTRGLPAGSKKNIVPPRWPYEKRLQRLT